MFKQLLAAATIATASLCIADTLPANAYTVRNECGMVFGYEACVNYQDAANPDVVMWQGPKGLERIEVSCFQDGTYEWESRGPHTQTMVNMAMNDFCSD
jgi:hypothetical protein